MEMNLTLSSFVPPGNTDPLSFFSEFGRRKTTSMSSFPSSTGTTTCSSGMSIFRFGGEPIFSVCTNSPSTVTRVHSTRTMSTLSDSHNPNAYNMSNVQVPATVSSEPFCRSGVPSMMAFCGPPPLIPHANYNVASLSTQNEHGPHMQAASSVVGVVPNVSPYSLDYSTHFPVAGMTAPSIGVPLFTGFEHAADAQVQAGRCVYSVCTFTRFLHANWTNPTCIYAHWVWTSSR